LIVTGRQPVAMRRAAAVGDGWMPYLYSPERYARSVATIRAEAERTGRSLVDFAWYAYIFVSLDDDEASARRAAVDFLGGTYRNDVGDMLDRVACVGTVEQVADRLASFIGAGAEHLVLVPCGPAPQESARRLLTEVRPALNSQVSSTTSKTSAHR
jgi:alkanesulfonate monooxygenase SsuD/methylene tetrahydromethanopterin reductase-like flavin-dependent oxidoreductase (luciferase family)